MLNSFSAINRATLIKDLKDTTFDVLVIGGGITGAGISLDAASRGLKVVLVEMQDFAAGTSSRSTKLIHGGLRYLKQFEFKIVAEVGREREIIYRNAPHLVRPEPILLPIVKNGTFGKFTTILAMWFYELLAGVKSQERHRFLKPAETLIKEPLLKKENLSGGILYYEYRTDDARLTISILKEASTCGALAINYMQVTGFTYDNGKITGVQTVDQVNQKSYTIRANYVVNASGPWVDELDAMDERSQGNKLQLTKGVHIVVSRDKLPANQAMYFEAFDKRMIFVIPREGKTYIGTTDTFYSGDKKEPLLTAEDKTYLLKCVNDYFAIDPLKSSDIQSGWAGLRPLIKKPGKNPSEISRKDETFVWASGLITIAGGKLTGYRKMACQVVDLIAKKISVGGQKNLPACRTDQIVLFGGKIKPLNFPDFIKSKIHEGLALGLTTEEIERLSARYGSEIEPVYLIIKKLKQEQGPEQPLPLLVRAELIYAIENEMCLTPCDFFIRRTGLLYFDIDAVKKYGPAFIDYMKGLFGWDAELQERYEKQLVKALANAQ